MMAMPAIATARAAPLSGVELVDGEAIRAREVVVCAGSVTSPQLLLHRRHAGRGEELEPGDADVVESIRAKAQTLYHPVGTCAIGAVVDAELRLRGYDGLRGVDASVLPQCGAATRTCRRW